MIIKSNNNVYKNYYGVGGISKVYAGENLVFGQETVKDYFRLTAIQDADIILNDNNGLEANRRKLWYSTDRNNWTEWDYVNETLNLPAGNTLYFKGDNANGISNWNGTIRNFVLTTGEIEAGGNILSLLYKDNFENNLTAPNGCFHSLFLNCTALTKAPELPALTIGQNSYTYMFKGCSNLVQGPSILPAMVLPVGCYYGMFIGCSKLTTAPVLPGINLGSVCYDTMFSGCSSLNYIKAMFTTIPSSSYTRYWMENVSSTGTFVMNAAAEWDPEQYRSSNGIPEGWTVIKE